MKSRIVARFVVLIACVCILFCNCNRTKRSAATNNASSTDYDIPIDSVSIVNATWIQRALINNERQDQTDKLVYEFAQAHPTEHIPIDTAGWYPFLSIQRVNLSDYQDSVCVAFVGRDEGNTMLCIMNCINSVWRLIHYEYYWTHNLAPDFSIVEDQSVGKMLSLSWRYAQGTGWRLYGNRYYKVERSHVQRVLEFIDVAGLYMSGPIGGGLVTTHTHFSSARVSIQYKYELTLSLVPDSEDVWTEPQNLVSDSGRAVYDWSASTNKYLFNKDLSKPGLTEKQINYFWSLGDVDLLVDVFQQQLRDSLSSSSEELKEAIKQIYKSKSAGRLTSRSSTDG